MKKGLRNALIISVSLSIICFISACCLGMFKESNWVTANENIRMENGMYKESLLVNQTTSETINNITINAVDKNIEIIKSTENEISINYYSNYKNEFKYEVENGNLTLTQEKHYFWLGNIINLIFEKPAERVISILLPEKQYNDIALKTISGNISAKNLITSNLNINCTSGNIKLSEAEVLANLEVNNISGSVYLTSCSVSENAQIKNTSGKIKLESSTLNNVNIKNISGGIELNKTEFTKLIMKNTSGSNKVLNSVQPSNLTNFSTNTTSGNCYIDGVKKGKTYEVVVENAVQSIESSTVSGSFHFN